MRTANAPQLPATDPSIGLPFIQPGHTINPRQQTSQLRTPSSPLLFKPPRYPCSSPKLPPFPSSEIPILPSNSPTNSTYSPSMEWFTRPQPRRNQDRPSFSSSLLDAIYRSIDQPDSATSLTRQTRGAPDHPQTDKITTPVIPTPLPRRHSFVSTSSDSNYTIFSSSSSSSADTSYPYKITTPVSHNPVHRHRSSSSSSSSSSLVRDQPAPEKKSIRSRLRELGKSKTPASPGARLASFLNSLFATASSSKKSKIRAPSPEEPEMRSCLSKTPSSAGRSSGKRSVRFWPVGVLVGEDCRPCGSRWIYGGDRAGRMAEMMRGLEEEEEEDGDDVASDASSDLFELENLPVVGGGFRDELPVYETTYLRTNRAIASRIL